MKSNIDEYISELKASTNLNFSNETTEKGYKTFQSDLLIDSDHKKKFQGFGRSGFEALLTSLKGAIEYLLQDEKSVQQISNSMKMFTKVNKETQNNKENVFENNISNNYKSFTLNYNLVPETIIPQNKVLQAKMENMQDGYKDSQMTMNMNDDLALTSNDLGKLKTKEESSESNNMKKELEEKNLIILEMEKLILDIMNYNKKIIEYFDVESGPEAMPNYFKCPISWEKMENPVITNEGHSYEKWALEKWLNNQNTSPVTGLVLTDRTLTNNYNLKSSVDDFQKRQNRMKKLKVEFQKFITKSEYDLNDLKKYFHSNQN